MWIKINDFLSENWLNLLLVIVGASAFVIYWLQGRRKISEAASLIVMQVEDLHNRISEMKTYITNGRLNDIAFYESKSLFKTDYWDQYKHFFIRKIDSYSLNTFDRFYTCATEVMEQQELMKAFQKNDLFLNQQTIMQMEANLLLNTLTYMNGSHIDNDNLIDGIMSTIQENITPEQKSEIEKILKQVIYATATTNYDLFWKLYNKNKQIVINSFNQSAFTRYTPGQITDSLEKALKQFDTIPIIGCEGYNKLKKLSKRRI